jgi:hypothetical protein
MDDAGTRHDQPYAAKADDVATIATGTELGRLDWQIY